MDASGDDITGLLIRWGAGDREALEHLTPLVYGELRKLARSLLRRERPGHTLSSTALVHEAYLKLIDQRRAAGESRTYFFGAAAQIMRRVLVDHAKKKFAERRGGSAAKLAMRDDIAWVDAISEDVLALDQVLSRLGEVDPRKVQVVEMKVFGGMTNQETARALGISDATVERDWTMARAWLIRALNGRPLAGWGELSD